MSLNSNINIPTTVQPVSIVPINPTSVTSDETYLESFIEQIQTLPSEIRRNLDLMKDLDGTCSTKLQQMSEQQKIYIEKIESKLDGLQVIDGKGIRIPKNKEQEQSSKKSSSTSKKSTKKKKCKDDDENEGNDDDDDYIVIPTTEEFLRYIHQNDDENNEEDSSSAEERVVSLSQIKEIQQDCLQQAEEKVMISKQTYRLVDNICRRLDIDIQHMEKLLLQTGEFQNLPGIAKPNDLAAIQAPGSTDWILAKVVSHDPTTSMYKLSDEDVESNKIFDLPESSVVILGEIRNLRTGDVVYAVYPETTAFYKGTISQAPRKVSGGGSFAMISFLDDHDENGVTIDKAVLLKHIMLPP